LRRILSISPLILPLLALASMHSLSAQTVVVDKTTLTFSGQFGGSAVSQTVNVTSSTGTSIPFALAYGAYPWLKVNGQPLGFNGTTPAALTITADPTGLAAGTYPASPPALISVSGGSANNNPPIAVTFTVSAIGVSPQSLAFSYTVLSNTFPASQVISLSSGVAIQCTATAATTSGGSWFTLLQNSCVSPGSLAVLINNAVVAGLAPNTYNGTVTITPLPAGQSPAAVVLMTLTVAPTPPVTVNPPPDPGLILNYQTGIAAPNPSQTFTISTTASQPLGFIISESGELAPISTFSPTVNGTTSSTSPAQITYAVNPSGLAPGAHTGTIVVSTPQGTPQQTNIPVKLNVSATALLNVPNATLNFAGQFGNTPAQQTVNITATSGVLNYSIPRIDFNPSANSSWLVMNSSWNTATPFPVSVNPAGLPPGTYSATVSVLSATPGSTAQTFPVVLNVTNEPTISASASTLSFPFQIGQTAPAAQSVKITSSTGAPLNYSVSLATTTCGSAWLQAANANNSLSGVTPPNDTLTVSVAPAGLAAGTCTGKITISATDPATGAAVVNSPISIAVTLFVSTTAQLVLAPANLQPFAAGVNAPSPPAQSITLTSTSTDVLNYTVAFQGAGGNWLFAGPQTGSTSASSSILTVSVIPAGLAANIYSGTVTVTATGPGGAAVADSPVTIPVTLNVTSGSLTLSATDLTFPDQTLGGSAPVAQTVTIGSSGQALNYSAVANSNNAVTWLAVSPASGNTSTNPALTVSVDGSKLTAGTYTGAIVVTAPGAGNSPVTINVHFKVNPGTLSAPTTTLTFTQAVGGPAPAAQSIAVTGSPAPLSFTIAGATTSGGNWLSATPPSGTTPSSVQVSVNGASLAVGQYIGTIFIASAGAGGSPIAVGVILNVVAPAVLAAAPTTLSFAYIVGLAVPAAQNLAISSTGGAGNVPVTAQVQYAGAAVQSWLTVTPTASNNTPATFAVSVATSGLAAGKYQANIVIASPTALASVTIPVTLTVTAIPQPVIGAVANAASYSTGGVSPGENIVIFGSGIGPATITSAVPVNGVFPSVVANTRVLFDGTAAPIIYVSSGQTSVMVPYGVAGRTSTNIVVEFSGVQSAPINQLVALAAPGIYTLNQQGTGPGAILNQDLSLNGLNNPEKRGNVIAIYMTGEGQTNPQGADGVVIPPVLSALKKPLQQVTVTIGGVDAVVAYAGSAPSLISGVMQVNAIIGPTTPTGPQPVVVTVGTAKTQSGASAATVVVQ
jgi:uncharacterized protein (TIGR03437 family)